MLRVERYFFQVTELKNPFDVLFGYIRFLQEVAVIVDVPGNLMELVSALTGVDLFGLGLGRRRLIFRLRVFHKIILKRLVIPNYNETAIRAEICCQY